jgi:hypothetical protein
VMRQLCATTHPPQSDGNNPPADFVPVQNVPIWDNVRRELRLAEVVAKRFRRPAKNQEVILAAFQEEGWPSRIDDPLFGEKNRDAQDRLHATVKKLNHQAVFLIRFLSDGAAEGILWELPKSIIPGSTHDRTRIGP